MIPLFNDNASKIIFLDMDGPVCNMLTHVTKGVIGGILEVCDDRMIGLLNRLYLTDPEHTAIVMNTTWSKHHGKDKTINTVINGGYIGKFHQDWTTNMGRYPCISVYQWLENHHEITHHIIIDDHKSYHPKDPLIGVNTHNGLTIDNVRDSFKLLHGMELVEASKIFQPE